MPVNDTETDAFISRHLEANAGDGTDSFAMGWVGPIIEKFNFQPLAALHLVLRFSCVCVVSELFFFVILHQQILLFKNTLKIYDTEQIVMQVVNAYPFH